MLDKHPLYYQAIGATIGAIIVLYLVTNPLPELLAVLLANVWWFFYFSEKNTNNITGEKRVE